jgi:hypothetical protein
MKSSVFSKKKNLIYLLELDLKGSPQKLLHFYLMGEEAMMYYSITNFFKLL